VAARVEQGGDSIRITTIRGTFSGALGEPPAITERILDFLIRSHALRQVFPAPIRLAPNWSPSLVATLCFQLFGSMAHVGSVEDPPRELPERPLRSLSLLHIAVARGDCAEVTRQLAKGIPIGLLNQEGLPPLHWALVLEKTEMLELLVSRGAGVEAPTSEGVTVLMAAAEFGKLDHLRWLLAQGANPRAGDNRGFTALHRAAELGHREIVELLLAAGADPHAEAQGHTAISVAREKGHAEIVRLLGG
jgi:ankyrin repeat protein